MGSAGVRIAGWFAWLLCFRYDIVWRPGATDCLSRLPLPYDQGCSPDMDTETVAAVPTLQLAVPISDLTDVCSSFPELCKLYTYITHWWPASSKRLHALLPGEVWTVSAWILVPVKLHSHMVQLVHEGHQGIVCTKQIFRDLYWWPKMDALVQSVIATCLTFQLIDWRLQGPPLHKWHWSLLP